MPRAGLPPPPPPPPAPSLGRRRGGAELFYLQTRREGPRSLRSYPEEAFGPVVELRFSAEFCPRVRTSPESTGGGRCVPAARREDGHPCVHRLLLWLRGAFISRLCCAVRAFIFSPSCYNISEDIISSN
ncbi:SH3 domain-binding glutamic acid-rich-like protein 2 isoform X1 [Pipistrellus kuhlii]|uniref:SH3 domain-binding glutamic acid-rich-like protein 2 isoform X1 n=1 Tax=Pipistrellus kuhlii TaxID=59472 RepID=UPI001E273A73|nr:SH3 domain-binding glutamic acid-rich-like protein 2 isoform X1 [Pipistrellus kuhlii]